MIALIGKNQWKQGKKKEALRLVKESAAINKLGGKSTTQLLMMLVDNYCDFHLVKDMEPSVCQSLFFSRQNQEVVFTCRPLQLIE